MNKKLLSVIVPVFDEAENVPAIYKALRTTLEGMHAYEFEIIFVNDGSTDGTGTAIENLVATDKNVKLIEFSRNFGKEMATTAGIEAAGGDAVIMIDADMQHPPSLIHEFVSKWEKGAEVVIGVRTRNSNEGFIKKLGSAFFYHVIRLISDVGMQHGETDFRLIDKAVADAFRTFAERDRMTRALINWLGFKKEYVFFEAPARLHGVAKYTPRKLVALALHSFVSNSLVPLRFAGYLGVFITFWSGVLGVVVLIERYAMKDSLGWNVSGSAQLAIINVFLIGVVLTALGIIALYIANIHTEVAGRPHYIVRKRKNFDTK